MLRLTQNVSNLCQDLCCIRILGFVIAITSVCSFIMCCISLVTHTENKYIYFNSNYIILLHIMLFIYYKLHMHKWIRYRTVKCMHSFNKVDTTSDLIVSPGLWLWAPKLDTGYSLWPRWTNWTAFMRAVRHSPFLILSLNAM